MRAAQRILRVLPGVRQSAQGQADSPMVRAVSEVVQRKIRGEMSEEQKEWTTNWPTKSGFYWIRNFVTNHNKDRGRESYPFPRVVWLDKDFDIYWVGTKEITQRKDMASAEWHGPIEPPA